jgi:hypothetical protein
MTGEHSLFLATLQWPRGAFSTTPSRNIAMPHRFALVTALQPKSHLRTGVLWTDGADGFTKRLSTNAAIGICCHRIYTEADNYVEMRKICTIAWVGRYNA